MFRSNVSERERPGDRLARIEAVLSRQHARHAPHPRRQPGPVRTRIAAFAFAIGFALFLTALGLNIVSAPSTGERILSRSVPTLSEEDSLLALHLSDLRAQAGAPGAKVVSLPWFPIALSLPASLLSNAPPQTIERTIDRLAAKALYQRGEAAFAVTGSSRSGLTGPLLSPTWTFRHALGLLNASAHARLQLLAVLLGLLSVALALLYSMQAGGRRWLAGVGIAGVVGAFVAGLGVCFAWLLVQLNGAGAGSPLGDAAWGMWGDITWTMMMVDAIALLCSAAAFIPGLALSRLGVRDRGPVAAVQEHGTGPELTAVGAAPRQRPLDRLPRTRRRLD